MDLREKHIIGNSRELLVDASACPALTHRGLLLAGISHAGEGFAFCRPRPRMHQVLACLDGRGHVLVDGTWQQMAAGQAYITPTGIRHAYHRLGPEPWMLVWVMCDAAAPWVAVPSLHQGDPRPLHDAILNLHRETLGSRDPDLLEHWAVLVALLARRLAGTTATSTRDRLSGLWETVIRDLARPWSVPDMACIAGVSCEHLRRLCLQAHGRPPLRHLTRLRLRHAQQLLRNTEIPIAAVAARVGYANPFAFTTAFHRRWGMSPSALRLAAL